MTTDTPMIIVTDPEYGEEWVPMTNTSQPAPDMTDEAINALAEAARKVGAETWYNSAFAIKHEAETIAHTGMGFRRIGLADRSVNLAAYIALANPQAILSLISRLTAPRGDREGIMELILLHTEFGQVTAQEAENLANAIIALSPSPPDLELREAARDVHTAILGKPVGAGDGQTFIMGYPSAEQLNRLRAALSAADALKDCGG